MKRRPLLAALTTGALGATAGCGYAYGGGDLRDEGSVGSTGFGSTEYALDDDRIVAARSGSIVDHDAGGFIDGTSVTLNNRRGERLWQHTHDTESVAVTASDPVYLLDEAGYVLALSATPPNGDRTAAAIRRDGSELWRVLLDDAQPALAGDDRGAYVAATGGLVAIRDGAVAWEVDSLPLVDSVLAIDETILVSTRENVVALAPAGTERWRFETAALATVVTAGGRVAVHDGRRISVRELTSGDQLWMAETDGRGGQQAMTENRLYVADDASVRAFDAATGELEWRFDGSGGLKTPLVAAPEGIYGVRGRCRTVAVNGSGARWTREVSVRSCSIVGGWLDGETVAFLFDSGELRWLQRTEQNPGLL